MTIAQLSLITFYNMLALGYILPDRLRLPLWTSNLGKQWRGAYPQPSSIIN